MTAVAGSASQPPPTDSKATDGSPSAAPQQATPQQAAPPQGTPRVASLPTLSLPKAGGAIRGIGEKFTTNAANGTGSLTVPIAVSPGRSGFGPQLTLSYDSGAGNGVFGLGWSLSSASISRKTDKGLPRYDDARESDVFILSGSEDLVPVLGWTERVVHSRWPLMPTW
jgi:Salmonella virulence plasmid 65kDa B protein